MLVPGTDRCRRHVSDYHNHLRLCRIRKWRRCSSCRHRTRTEKPGPRRKNSWKLHFPAALFSVCLMAFFFFFQTPLLYLFGASSNTIRYASTYISIYLVGTVFVELAVGLNTFISCQGHARTAMCSVLVALLSTLVLTRFSSSFFIWVFPGPHLLPFSPRL